ncbi:MAG: C40 family peptidase [Chitinophagaceae bacterium]
MNTQFACSCLVVSALLLSCGTSKKAPKKGGEEIVVRTAAIAVTPSPVTTYDSLQKKYAAYLKVEPDKITNLRLYRFIDQWLNTPYQWGGTSKKGIDCSSLIQQLLQNVYEIKIPRTSVEQFYAKWINKFSSTRHLSEGDLVFFRTDETKVVSHVGLYLGNRKFVNSSSSKGVSIANLDDAYWRRLYAGAGRVDVKMLAAYKK